MGAWKTSLLVFAAGLAAGRTALWMRHAETARLRAELADLHGQETKVARAREENARLVAGSLSPERLATMRLEQEELNALRREIAWFQQAAEKPASASGPSAPIPVSAWKNAGQSTPAAALETALWAAAGGDVEVLAATLEVNRAGINMIEAHFRALPQIAQEYGRPERLVAYFTTKEVPLGTMQILEQKETGPDDATMVVRLQAPDGKVKDVALALHRAGGGWRLKVPVPAVLNYLRVITQATAVPAAAPALANPPR